MGDRKHFGTGLLLGLLIWVAATGSAWAQGLQGEYWQSATIPATPGIPAGAPNPVRLDPVIDFTDTNPATAPEIFINIANLDNFVVRWSGFVLAPVSGAVTFSVLTDDGSQVSVDGTVVLSSWIGQAPAPYSGNINLTAGQWYPIEYLFYDSGGGARARLSWSYAGQADIVIPTGSLSPTAPPPAAPVLASPAVAGDTQVTLAWTHSGVPAATEFRVYTVNGAVYTLVGTTSNLTFTVTGLTNGTPYTFVVRAFNLVESADSNAVVATPVPPAPRLNDHSEGLLDGKCACGAVQGMSAFWALSLAAAILAALAFRRF